MEEIMQVLSQLSSAEEFMDFFGIRYDQRVLNVNRLHILKRFNQYLARHRFSGVNHDLPKAECRMLLERAYNDFVASDAATEKVFKVFQDASGVKTFSVESLRGSMRARNARGEKGEAV